MQHPTIYFNLFELGGQPGKFEAERATGTFTLDGKQVALTLPVPEQRAGESGADAFRRELVRVRDALTKIVDDPNGVRL